MPARQHTSGGPAADRHILVVAGRSARPERDIQIGVGRYAERQADWLVTFCEPEVLLGHRHAPWLAPGSVSGAVVVASDAQARELLRRIGCPVVIAGGRDEPGWPSCRPDDPAVGAVAARHLLSRGCRTTACLRLDPQDGGTDPGDMARLRACADGFTAAGQTPVELTLGFAPEVRARFRDRLAELPRPVALFAPNDFLAHFAVKDARRDGILVPEELAVLGCGDDELFCLGTSPSISSVDIPWRRLGEGAAALLHRRMSGARAAPVRLRPTGIVIRRSTCHTAVSDPLVVEALRLIAEVPTPMRVKTLAMRLGVPRRTLEARFGATLHRSPGAEIERALHGRLRELLIDRHLDPGQAQVLLGIVSRRQFVAICRRAFGCSPEALQS